MTVASAPALQPVDFDPFADGEILDTAPSTAAQIEVWVSAQMGDDASCAYNESVTLTCTGRLDERAMRESLVALVTRHEGLRTTFSRDGKTLCIAAPWTLDVPLVDLGDRREDARRAAFAELLQREVTTPFDLEHGPLFKACIVRMGDDDHRVVMTAHHVVCDGWSFAVLFQDLGAFYTAKRRSVPPELKEVHRFSDYARAERVGGAEQEETEAYWVSQYQGSIPVVDLPTDRPRAKMRSYTSERVDYVLPNDLVSALKKTGAKAGASFFVTMFTAFASLMSRLSGQSDLVVGIPAAGQSAVGKEMLVGHCANLLPVRVRIDGEHTFVDALKGARKVVLDAYDHQRYTFGSLLSKLPIARDPSRIPLAPILFNIDVGMEGSGLKFEGLEVSFAGNPRAFENFEIFVNGVESKGAVTLETQYSTALWDRETIEARLAAFEALLRTIVERPDERVSRLPSVSAGERQRLLAEWNDTRVDVPGGATIDALFEAQAALTPDRIAARSGKDRATYAELDARANRIAGHLGKLGVGRGALVGLCVERSIDMVAGMLGILKTGAAYVPMDPEFPRARLAHMASDSKLGLVLSQRELEDVVPEGPRVVLLEDEAIGKESPARPATRSGPEDRAYVIYTSGSTGLPKGVELPHRAVVSFLTTMKQRPGLSPDDVLMAVTTLSFDIAVLELLLPIVVGATTIVCPRDVASDGYQLLDALRDTKATVMQATPATWRLLIAAGWSGGLKVLCGGEALPPDLARTLVERAGTVWNMYGPTETTVWSTCQEISERDPRVVIGRPIGNTTCYVLDARRELVPAGIPGELWIGGSGVALGYLGRAELTAERFVADPFTPAALATMYRTGDVVRWQRDGVLEYLSRNDDQVKVRGYRIELGEIEAVLNDHAAVVEGAVALVEDKPGDVRVMGYVVLKPGEELTVTEVRRHLRKKLPDYMIPNGIIELPSLPRTPNGKIDRKALAAVSRPTRAADVAVPPRTAAERLVAEVWQSALRLDRVGVHDNFYELGGDSLTSMDVVVRIQERTRVRISPRSVLLNSLEQIAAVVESSAVVG